MTHGHDSHLSDPKYGYDFVVATTQNAINSVMKQFLYENSGPKMGCCYVSEGGKEIQLTLDEFATRCKTDPFEIPDGTDVKHDDRIKDMNKARFIRGWCARIGLPDVDDPSELEDLVELTKSSETVKLRLYCAEFQLVSYIEGGRFDDDRWMNVSQPQNKPWTFTSHVDLSQHTVDWDKNEKGLPTDVLDAAKKLDKEDIFGIDQLILDLNTAKLMTETPQIDGVQKGTPEYTMLLETFLGLYFDDAKKKGNPLLSCVIKMKSRPSNNPAPMLKLTDFRYSISPYRDVNGKPIEKPDAKEKEAGTINYLCAANGHKLPEATAFSWNWVHVSELSLAHGVIAIQRNTLVDYVVEQLKPHMLSMAIKPKHSGDEACFYGGEMTWDFSDTAPADIAVTTKSGAVVFKMDWDSGSYTNTWDWKVSYNTARVYYKSYVSFHLNTITVYQRFRFYMKCKWGINWGEAYVIDHAIKDTYELAITDQGKLEVKHTPGKIEDNSQELKGSIALCNFDGRVKKKLSDKIRVKLPKIQHLPASFIQDYVFPGGKAFIFKDVAFSDHEDLVSYITYADQ